MPEQPLFDEKTRRSLEQLILQAAKVRAGAIKGERRSIKRGTSIEFADTRAYSPGDDLRRLDWNAYARLERPLTRLFEDEEDLAVHVLIDSSASMDYPRPETDGGSPAHHKFDFARRLMAGLGYISLTTNDRLTVTRLGGESAAPVQYGPVRGRGHGAGLLQFAAGLRAHGTTDLNAALKSYALRGQRPGLCLVISDLFSPTGLVDGLNALVGKGYEVAIVQVLAPEEVEPALAGDLRLIDSETGAAQEISMDAGLRDLYIRRVRAWRDGLRQDCAKRGVHYVEAITDAPWEKVILYDLRRLGVVR
ncbi:MAG: DUF58 domain-containing protein [bacterium]|nr:DUF58 domain-containing protein [bacterium]